MSDNSSRGRGGGNPGRGRGRGHQGDGGGGYQGGGGNRPHPPGGGESQRGRGRGYGGGGGGGRGGGGGGGRGGGYGGGGPGGLYLGNAPAPPPDPNITRFENEIVNDIDFNMRALQIEGTNLSLPRRPNYMATVAKPGESNIVVRTNFLDIKIDDTKNLWVYDVELPLGLKQKKNYAKAKRTRYFELFVQAPLFKNVRLATDYSKFLITDKKLDIGDSGMSIEVIYHDKHEFPFPAETANEAKIVTDGRRLRTRTMRIQPTKAGVFSVNIKDFLDDVRSGGRHLFESKDSIIQALNIIFNHSVRSDPGVAAVGSKFYRFSQGPVESYDLGQGLSALRGYYTSIRIAPMRLLLNVNVVAGTFYRDGELRDLINEFSRDGEFGGPGQLSAPGGRLRPHTQDAAHLFLRGVKVICKYNTETLPNGKSRVLPKVRTIYGMPEREIPESEYAKKGIKPKPHESGKKQKYYEMNYDASPNNLTIQLELPDGTKPTVSVTQFFQNKFGVTLQNPKGHVVNVGNQEKPSYIPIELCYVFPGQAARGLLSGNQTSNMIRFAARFPKDNAESIATRGLELLKITPPAVEAQNHGAWSFQVGRELKTVPARILKPPNMVFKDNKVVTPNDGTWNMKGVKLYRTSKVPSWVCLWISRPNKRTVEEAERRAKMVEVANEMRKYGINISNAVEIRHITLDPNNAGQINQRVGAEFRRWSGGDVPKPKLAWVVVPGKLVYLKARIKYFSEYRAGIQTMLIQEANLYKSPDVLANEALKLNLRFGGLNWTINSKDLHPLDGTYMVMGIDVTHPDPQSVEGAPSIAAVVASVDGQFGLYCGDVCSQDPKVEMVRANLTAMVTRRLNCWANKNGGRYPQNIIVYRDGVSDGQYSQVLQHEYAAGMLPAFKDTYKDEKKFPHVSIIVVTKRHHVRFYPTNPNDVGRGKTMNCKPGLCVDRHITGGGRQSWDMYLQAHAAIQGTAKPAHYVVIKHGIPAIGVEELPRMTNALCYMWQRAPRSVSYAPPAYYADVLAERGRGYLHDAMRKTGKEGQVFDRQNAGWGQGTHADLNDTMFFV